MLHKPTNILEPVGVKAVRVIFSPYRAITLAEALKKVQPVVMGLIAAVLVADSSGTPASLNIERIGPRFGTQGEAAWVQNAKLSSGPSVLGPPDSKHQSQIVFAGNAVSFRSEAYNSRLDWI